MMEQLTQLSPTVQTDLCLEAVQSYGVNRGQGNLVGVQSYMTAVQYATADQFHTHLDGYLAAAQAEGWLHANTIVIFPENIGTWLLLVNENSSIIEAETMDSASKRMVSHHLPRFLWTLPQAAGRNRAAGALFRMKAQQIAAVYQDTFAQLAATYGVTIVAGSVFLPQPEWGNGRLHCTPGPLQNVCCVFASDGRAYPTITRKVHLVPDEGALLQGGHLADLPVYDTLAGRLGVLICADSWYPTSYEALAAQEVDIIAVPNNQGGWHKPWGGYLTPPVPDDVDTADIGRLTEEEAWLKYALAGRMGGSGARVGMQVFFHGRMWDQVSEGQSIILKENQLIEAPDVPGAALINVWL
ncbi:MAG: carbon-nitrogen hydrolase family protein [Anaerolineae bacterium]|nr:carbon-nitrogen hydrolase family protein [Anaerolineae bacterium]